MSDTNETIGAAHAILTADLTTARDLAMASAYLDRAGKHGLSREVREQSTARRKLAQQQRVRMVSAIVRGSEFPVDDIPAELLADILTASPRRLTDSLRMRGMLSPE